MAVRLFSLHNVPDDEAEDICRLLEDNGIAYYDTPAGFWGFIPPAIWLQDKEQLERARALIEDYQAQRFQTQRAAYEQQCREGGARSLWHSFRDDPLRFLLYLGIILVILYFSIKPFLALGL